jgi:membrane-bound metal-dependent hydrolase YbcI (DUF457 family)
MNLRGHAATGVALAVIGFGWGGGDLAQAFAVGAVAGSIAPDLLEVPVFVPGSGKRLSIIPHRTWTHFWPFWIALIAVVPLLAWPWPSLAAVVLGGALGGLLHLAMDVMTPMGLPVSWPPTRRARRKSLHVYRNGEFVKEWGVVAAVWAVALVVGFGPGLIAHGVEWLAGFVGL